MSEVSLWTKLRRFLPRGKFTRVENGEAGPGTPDVHYRLHSNDGWIELKDARHPKSDIPFPNEDVGLHKSQRDWIRDYVWYSGLVWIVARIGKEVFWIHGRHFSGFNGATKKRLRSMASLVHHQNVPDLRKIKRMLEGEDR